MVIRKILERLRGSQEPLSFEQAQVSFERAQAEYEAAERESSEIYLKNEAAGLGITQKWLEASYRADVLRHRLRQAKANFILVGGSHDTVELTELVTRKVKQWFRADEQAEAIRLLETECARNLPLCETWDAKELEGVRLAVVKLAGGSLVELRRQIEEAKKDVRDMIAFAQAPEEVKRWRGGLFTGAELDAETREMRARDRQQYEEWLREDGPSDPPAV